MFVPRKPHPIVEGKDAPRQRPAPAWNEKGNTVGLLLHLWPKYIWLIPSRPTLTTRLLLNVIARLPGVLDGVTLIYLG
jgi:hypothetical protein